MAEGLIIKALSGYYYVLPAAAEPGGDTVQCRARGIFKLNKVTPLVGDKVVYERTENGEGTVIEIMPRSSELVRPPVANAELAVLVFSIAEPALGLQLLDKFLVHIEHAGLEPVICLTKQDLLHGRGKDVPEKRASEEVEHIKELYERIGYSVFITSARRTEGVAGLAERLKGRISLFAGQSGVGKSSLLNVIVPGVRLETNQISMKLGRGKHTTRHVELIPLPDGGWVADTPGFSQLDFVQLEPGELAGCFREFRPYAADCRFRGCLHSQEPDCKVREAARSGSIAESRYDHYLQFLSEMKDKKRRY